MDIQRRHYHTKVVVAMMWLISDRKFSRIRAPSEQLPTPVIRTFLHVTSSDWTDAAVNDLDVNERWRDMIMG
jgi:hypothetical protein